MQVPVLVKDFAMVGTGFYPYGEDQVYRTEKEGLNLIGTAEVPVTSYHGGEILSMEQLPLRYVAMSTCFRREAGAAGRDTRGLYRVHQFQKVEQVVLCANDRALSDREHMGILENSEEVVRALGLPYRVVNVCGGDLGLPQARKYDIETWMPSRNGYGETHSASKFYDYQARRLMIRYRDENKKVRFVHTLNNTVVASPRLLIPLLEIYQTRDGKVNVPEVLRPYMGGMEQIEPV
jgi:seryl-tRNA synthetase